MPRGKSKDVSFTINMLDSLTELIVCKELADSLLAERHSGVHRGIDIINGEGRKEMYSMCYSCHKKFEVALHVIVSGAEPGVCANVVEDALNLLKQASFSLLSFLQETFNEIILQAPAVFEHLKRSCQIQNSANAAQTVVELLLDDNAVSNIIPYIHCCETWLSKWARMIHFIFQGVQKGTLFLKTSLRIILFNEWRWVLSASILDFDDAHIIPRFISTYPQQQQDIWMGVEFGADFEPSLETYTTWVSYMVNGKAKRQQEHSSSSARKPKAN